MQQPVHDEDNSTREETSGYVAFDEKPDTPHWIWDTGLLDAIPKRSRRDWNSVLQTKTGRLG
jgi:hypothetical protein